MNIKKVLILLLFLVAIVGIIAPINAVDSANSDKINIKWDANGGKIGNKKTVITTVNKGSKIGTLQKATRTGYTLKGWYTKKTGGTKISKDTKPKESTPYYAQWKKEDKKNDVKKFIGKWVEKASYGTIYELIVYSNGNFTHRTTFPELHQEEYMGVWSVKNQQIATKEKDYRYKERGQVNWKPYPGIQFMTWYYNYNIKNGKECLIVYSLEGGNAIYYKT